MILHLALQQSHVFMGTALLCSAMPERKSGWVCYMLFLASLHTHCTAHPKTTAMTCCRQPLDELAELARNKFDPVPSRSISAPTFSGDCVHAI